MLDTTGHEIGQEVVLRRREWTLPTYAPAALAPEGGDARAAGASPVQVVDVGARAQGWLRVWVCVLLGAAATAAAVMVILGLSIAITWFVHVLGGMS